MLYLHILKKKTKTVYFIWKVFLEPFLLLEGVYYAPLNSFRDLNKCYERWILICSILYGCVIIFIESMLPSYILIWESGWTSEDEELFNFKSQQFLG
jgi:hypothetical protein